jgi:hypothetical protein
MDHEMTVRMLSLDRQGYPDSYIIEPGNSNAHFSSSGYNIDSEIAGDDGDESGNSSSNRPLFNQSQQQYIRPDMHLPPLRVMYSQGQNQSNNNSGNNNNNNHLQQHNPGQPLLKMQLSPPRTTHGVMNNNYTSHNNHNIQINSHNNNIPSGNSMNINLLTPIGSLDRDRDRDIGR